MCMRDSSGTVPCLQQYGNESEMAEERGGNSVALGNSYTSDGRRHVCFTEKRTCRKKPAGHHLIACFKRPTVSIFVNHQKTWEEANETKKEGRDWRTEKVVNILPICTGYVVGCCIWSTHGSVPQENDSTLYTCLAQTNPSVEFPSQVSSSYPSHLFSLLPLKTLVGSQTLYFLTIWEAVLFAVRPANMFLNKGCYDLWSSFSFWFGFQYFD